MNNWLTTGQKIDAIAANNDEMAIGALIALQQAGRDPKKMCIGRIDATPDALAELTNGNHRAAPTLYRPELPPIR